MTATAVEIRVRIDLLDGCSEAGCLELAWRMKNQLDVPNYSRGMSVMAMPDTLEQWRAEHRTARKRADRAVRLGHRFDEIDRSKHNDEIFEINTSLERRQGRPMTDGYTKPHRHGRLPDYPCARHAVRTYGVLQGDTLRAYLTLYRVVDLSLVSMILGHGMYLDDGIMFLLFQGVVAEHAGDGGSLVYNRHDSGKADGLVWFKERLGFTATDIEWTL